MATTARPLTGAGTTVSRRSQGVWRDAFGRLRKNKLAMVGLFMVIALLALGILGPALAPWRFSFQDSTSLSANNFFPLKPFSDLAIQTRHFLGTDDLGRDELSRLMDGAQISMTVAFVVQVVVILIGVPIGGLAGWFGGRPDTV